MASGLRCAKLPRVKCGRAAGSEIAIRNGLAGRTGRPTPEQRTHLPLGVLAFARRRGYVGGQESELPLFVTLTWREL